MEAAAATELKYAFWRTDKPKEEGFSHELIAYETEALKGDLDKLEFWPYEGVDTALKALRRTVERIPDHGFLGTRVGKEYQWMSWKDAFEKAENLSYGCMALNLVPETDGEGDGKKWRMMGVQSKNRAEQTILNIAGMFQNVTTVALYDTLGEEASKYIIGLTQLSTIAVSMDLVKKVCDLKKSDAEKQEIKCFTNLVVYEDAAVEDEQIKTWASEAGLTLYSLNQIVEKGKEAKAAGEIKTVEPTTDDTFMLSFTSGTTGVPKGVKLTHKMLITDSYGINARMGYGASGVTTDENDAYISYLPFAHSFEQVNQGQSFIYGLKIGFFSGDVTKLTEDCQILQPTVFPSVPRLYNRIYALLNAKFKSGTPEEVAGIKMAVETKLNALHEGKGVVHEKFDAAVFSKVRPLLGGKVKVMTTGSAPIAKEVMDFFKIAFSVQFLEGYGMTENCGGACVTMSGDPQTGHVGGPLHHIKIKLMDIPEMNYLSTNETPEGEVCFYGGSIMPGYFKNPEKTAESIDKDGWLHSGDVGRVLPNGSLKIIDRAKNIFKLSQGEYIAPEKLENVYIQSDFVVASWVYGDSLRDYVVAFIVVEPLAIKKVFGGGAEDFQITEELLAQDNIKQVILDQICGLADANKFNSLEKPKQITLLAKPFNEINEDLMTPTFKMKRNVAKTYFQEQIAKMYDAPPMSATKK